MKPKAALLQDLLERIRGVVQPTRVILFGSAARGEMRPDSDIDVLVEVPDGVDIGETEGDVYCAMIGFPMAVDVVVATKGDLRLYGNNFSLVYYPALREGVEVYAAQ